jgi:signal transduction histidine kinase
MTEGDAISRRQLDLMNLLAHDLKNPIGSALANLGFAEEATAGDPELPGALRDATAALHRILQIVDDIAVASRHEAGELVVRKQPCSALEIVNAVARTAIAEAGSGRIELSCPPELTVSADAQLLRRALDAVVDASLRWASRGAILVGARDEGEDAVFFVAHDAPTLETEPRLRAFLERGAAAAPASIGLALYFARSVADAHGGKLVLRKAPGWATEIGIGIPR